jgi:hypothetical protein
MTPSALAASTPSTATAVVTPDPPAHLSDAAKKQWTSLYVKALGQAQRDSPDNERAQRTFALKSANQMLSVTPPTDAAGIAALQPWQVLLRSDRIVGGVRTRICVTTDGRKYSFPIDAPAAAEPATLESMTKAQLVAHAADVHGLVLDPSLKKEDLIAAVAEAATK